MTEQVTLAKPARKPAVKKAADEKPVSTPFKSLSDIRLGMIVRDPASGLTGVVNMKAEMLSGSVQYAILPQGDGKTIPDGHFIDDFMLEYVSEGVAPRTPGPDVNARFLIGEELQDTITGFKGIATERITYLNGCVRYCLQPQKKSWWSKLLGTTTGTSTFDHKQLKKIGAGVVPTVVAQIRAKEEPKPEPENPKEAPPIHARSRTGGPTRSASIYSQRA